MENSVLNLDLFCFKWPGSMDEKRSELLPQGWNTSQEIYSLRYVMRSGKRFLAKFVKSDQSMLISFVNVNTEKASGLSVNINNHVSDSFDDFENAYKQIEEVYKSVEQLFSEIEDGNPMKDRRPISPGHDSRYEQDVDDPLRVPCSGMSNIHDNRPVNPFSVGRGDLDPLGRSEGGMLMDPRGLPAFGGMNPGGIPGLPRGAAPPGARFDPVGPGRPHRYFGPDNDHFQPPGFFDDRFM
uniref:Proteasome inhibitor PI31 subunit n=1 Tax=Hadrurus spadix TaxID=141984 RepID=A0A1W7R9V5_9SCOR